MRDVALRWFELVIHARLPEQGGVISFLRSYFEPAITLGPVDASTPAPFATLEVHLGPPPPEAPAPDHGAPLEIDRSGGFLRCDGLVTEADGVRWIWLTQFAVLVRSRGTDVALWATDARALRVPILRITEDLILAQAQRRGTIVVHASAVVSAGRAVLFCGNKGAGKTTALLRALELPGASLLANDNVCVTPFEGGYRARAWPAFLKVEVGTIATTAALATDLPASCAPLRRDPAGLWDVYEKVALYPGQAAARFGAELSSEAALGALVFPQFRADHAPGLTAIAFEQAADLLSECLQGVFNPNHGPWLDSDVAAQEARAAVHASLRAFLAWLGPHAVPLYGLSWAPALADLLTRIPLLNEAWTDPRAPRREPQDDERWPPLPAAPSGLTFKSKRPRRG